MKQIEIFEEHKNKRWLVSSSKNCEGELLEYYSVSYENIDYCECYLFCNKYKACLHIYTCTCHDNAIQYNMCKQIYLVCQKYPRKHPMDTKQNNNFEENPESVIISDQLKKGACRHRIRGRKNQNPERCRYTASIISVSNNSDLLNYISTNISSIISGIRALEMVENSKTIYH